MKKTLGFLVAAALIAVPSAARAQASADISAIAQVATQLSVTAGNDLDFGTVLPGFNSTVDVTDGGAGSFSLNGAAGAEVQLSFSLPTDLDDGLGNLLPVSGWSGAHNGVNDPGAGATPFDPTTGDAGNLSGVGELFVFLGATADASSQFTPGTYSATITLTAAYTGN